MEEETTKEDIQPSTSKKESQRNSRNDLYDERGHDERASNSETSVSATYSARSQIDIVDARPEPPKPTLDKKEAKAPERKKRAKRSGRVEKRGKSYTRRQVRRAPMRRKPAVRHAKAEDRRMRDHSVSTIFTRLSSQSDSRSPGCVHCGHRCCRRRYEYKYGRFVYRRRRFTGRRYRKRKRMLKKKIIGDKKLKKTPKVFTRPLTAFSKLIQAGSRSHMFSPLFINTNSTPEAEETLPPQTCCDVTPEMIFETLRVLNLWKQEVPSVLILEYIRRNYPVNNVETELIAELKEKLRIASIVGMVVQISEDSWSLAGELEQRQLSPNHVTLFWKVYSDTINPIHRREAKLQNDSSELPSDKRRDDLI